MIWLQGPKRRKAFTPQVSLWLYLVDVAAPQLTVGRVLSGCLASGSLLSSGPDPKCRTVDGSVPLLVDAVCRSIEFL